MENGKREARPLSFTQPNEGVDDLIEKLMDEAGAVQHRAMVREMILAALKAGQESPSLLDLKLMNTTLKEMRFTAKVFAPYRHVRKVTVFGSARTPPMSPFTRWPGISGGVWRKRALWSSRAEAPGSCRRPTKEPGQSIPSG